MKITKRLLRRIIKEERSRLLKEQEDRDMAIMDDFEALVDKHRIQDPIAVLDMIKGRWEEMLETQAQTDDMDDDDPGFILSMPKEDPMGRGAETSSLRRSVMRR